MIRKDQLPNIWGDDWQTGPSSVTHRVSRSDTAYRSVLCDINDWDSFHMGGAEDFHAEELSHDQMEYVLEEGASMELYLLQLMGSETFHRFTFRMQAGARLKLRVFTLGGHRVRNEMVVRMDGEGCELDADGLYLADHDEEVDNYIFVEHAVPHCTSRTLYKGIIDDSARARFNGHVLVQDGAVKTEAFQTNRNILLTDKAHVDTRPFLEIYNDDVKCSHGSTIGQIDEQALFYLQTRGISERTARTLLLYAFCDEVIEKVEMPSLRDTLSDMVKKRLHGELTPCSDCALHCTDEVAQTPQFAIDTAKL